MTPLALIKAGIEKGSWEDVRNGYHALTGETLPLPESEIKAAPSPTLESIMQDIQSLAGVVPKAKPKNKKVAPAKPPEIDYEGMLEEMTVKHESESDGVGTTPEPDPETTRARQLAEARGRKINLDQFKVQNGVPKRDDGKKFSEGRPIGPFKNNFIDDGSVAVEDIEIDRLMTAGLEPAGRRPPPIKTKIICSKCNTTCEVDPVFAPKKLAADDQNSFVCDSCLKGKSRGRRSC